MRKKISLIWKRHVSSLTWREAYDPGTELLQANPAFLLTGAEWLERT